MKLDEKVSNLVGVGPKMAEKLERLGIVTIRDLLFYYPRTWDDFSHPQKISNLRINNEAIIKAEINTIKKTYTKRRWMVLIEAEIKDNTGTIKAVWFNQPFILNIIKPGDIWLIQGKISWDLPAGRQVLRINNKVLRVSQYEKEPIILPVYPETEGLTSKYLRKLIKPILTDFDYTPGVSINGLEDYLPEEFITSEDLIGLEEALQKIHFPQTLLDIDIAKKRLAFDELLFIALKMLLSKKELSKSRAIALNIDDKILKDFTSSLPFKLTNAQRKSAWEIILDLKKSIPMNRLLEGDVGSGKTVVAAMAVLVAASSGYQSVWLAPTEILANQHFQNVSKLLKLFKIKVGLWTGARKYADLQKDDLIIGTHALIQKNISFKKLALIIVDEQHRFGVKQRAQLRQTAHSSWQTAEIVPHFLSMTATPIPRTLALAFYGDLNISIIDELPAGRQKIITKIVPPEKRKDEYQFIETQIKSGRQAFVICPLIEEAKAENRLFDIDRKSAIKEYEKLSKEIFPDLRIGLLHGKMKSKEKDEIMTKFKNRKIDILVSTAVIEVGIDIANACIMMIESAERFGLAQLHQFRGRVGRGKHQAYCLLFSESWSKNAQKRLGAMLRYDNGFELAQVDLELRGPGELSGFRQSGLPDLKIAMLSDRIMIEKARKVAQKIVDEGIEKYPKIITKLREFESTKHME